jgi:hypothetical protein
MTWVGLLFRVDARMGREEEAARFFGEELPLMFDDLPTTDWATLRFGPLEFGVYDTFRLEEGQRSHVGDRIAAALREREADLFEGTPRVEGFDVLAAAG